MSTATKRFWYLYNGNIAIVEDGHDRTVGATTVTIDTITADIKTLEILIHNKHSILWANMKMLNVKLRNMLSVILKLVA